MQGVAWKHMRRHTNLRQNGYIIFAFNTTWRCLSGQREASGWNILDQSLYYTARAFFKNPKAWGPGPLKFLFLNASKIKPQEAEGPSNSSGILSYVLHASAQFGAGLNEVTRWSWQIWQEACEKKKSLIVFLQSRVCLSFMRAVRKNTNFWSLKHCFFCKARLVWIS